MRKNFAAISIDKAENEDETQQRECGYCTCCTDGVRTDGASGTADCREDPHTVEGPDVATPGAAGRRCRHSGGCRYFSIFSTATISLLLFNSAIYVSVSNENYMVYS